MNENQRAKVREILEKCNIQKSLKGYELWFNILDVLVKNPNTPIRDMLGTKDKKAMHNIQRNLYTSLKASKAADYFDKNTMRVKEFIYSVYYEIKDIK